MTTIPKFQPTEEKDDLPTSFGSLALIKENRKKITAVVPEGIDANKILMAASKLCSEDKDLQKANPEEVLKCVIDIASLGLEVGTLNQYAYILPYKGKLTPVIDYKGYQLLASRAGASIKSRVIYKADTFEVKYGLKDEIYHVPDVFGSRDDKDVIGVYAIVTLPNGHYHIEIMSREEVECIKELSPSASSPHSPWIKHYAAMARKTVIRRAFKYTPTSDVIQKAVNLDERTEAKEKGNNVYVGKAENVAESLAEEL